MKKSQLRNEFENLLKSAEYHLGKNKIYLAEQAYENLRTLYDKVENKRDYNLRIEKIKTSLHEAYDLDKVIKSANRITFEVFLLVGLVALLGYFAAFNGSFVGFAGLDLNFSTSNTTENITAGAEVAVIEEIVNETEVVNETIINKTIIEPEKVSVVDILETSVQITSASCNWNGSLFEVCESVSWSNGSYAKGYISGTKALPQIEAVNSSLFTYCEFTEKAGVKALHAYVYDENGKILAKQIDAKIECITGNNTLVNFTYDDIANESIAANESVLNETVINVTDITNEVNVTNVTIGNVSANLSVVQYTAVIGQPVKWKKVVKLENLTSNLTVDLPKDAKVITIKKIENNISVDITNDVVDEPNAIT
ncbi:MAG: hypothetical protein Q8R00_02345, partial [Candidatus Nanoarchaeia archaeon]|nr:hypothetical protein [Candidatus Nanoarchaeia archaeon]